jgi:hypothetical protein
LGSRGGCDLLDYASTANLFYGQVHVGKGRKSG